MTKRSYTFLDYFQMPVTWIVILLSIIILQLMTRRRCVNVHLKSRTGGQSFRDILSNPAYPVS